MIRGRAATFTRRRAASKATPLPPSLFSLGQHEGLQQAAADLQSGQELLAFLDDLYVITRSARAKPALDVVTDRVQEHCGIASNDKVKSPPVSWRHT